MLEKVIARLLHHILQTDKGGLIVLTCLLQRLNRLFDRLAIFAWGRFSVLGRMNPSQRIGWMSWKTCLRSACPRMMRPAVSASQRNCRSPCGSGDAVMATTCFQAGPPRSPPNPSSLGHKAIRRALTTARLASKSCNASAWASSGRRDRSLGAGNHGLRAFQEFLLFVGAHPIQATRKRGNQG